MGLYDLANDGSRPGFGMNATLTCVHSVGMYAAAKLHINSLRRIRMSATRHGCNSAGNMPSGPGDLYAPKDFMAQHILLKVKIWFATRQSSLHVLSCGSIMGGVMESSSSFNPESGK